MNHGNPSNESCPADLLERPKGRQSRGGTGPATNAMKSAVDRRHEASISEHQPRTETSGSDQMYYLKNVQRKAAPSKESTSFPGRELAGVLAGDEQGSEG